MGPSLAKRAGRARELAGWKGRVVAVSRFSDPVERAGIEEAGVETISRRPARSVGGRAVAGGVRTFSFWPGESSARAIARI
jgi:hypothetical protein